MTTFTTLEDCQAQFNVLLDLVNQDSHDHEGSGDGGHDGHFHANEGCEKEELVNYNQALHIGAVFIIFACSVIGTLIPIVSTHVKQLRIPRYAIIFGKCMGIGVVIACALIHMLLPAVASLESECLPESFRESYEGYPYLFCMLAIFVMQFMDFSFLHYMTRKAEKGGDHHGDHNHHHGEVALKDLENQTPGGPNDCHAGHAGHVHGGLLMDPAALKTIEAYLLEFGITVHSVFIGLAIGVVNDETLKALLVALVFHQFFEGVALGSRISDAKLKSHWHEALLTAIFSFSAPIGIAIGIGVVNSINVNGSDFRLVQGVFDSVCAGVLLYIGLNLLLKDFPEDQEQLCKGKKFEYLLRSGLFAAMWIGAGVMALLGKWL